MKNFTLNLTGMLLISSFFGSLSGLIMVLVQGALGFEHDLSTWAIQVFSLLFLLVISMCLIVWFAKKWEKE